MMKDKIVSQVDTISGLHYNPDFTVIKTSEFEQMKTKAKFQRAYIIELRRGLTIENTENNRLRIANYELSAKIEKLEQKISRLTR